MLAYDSLVNRIKTPFPELQAKTIATDDVIGNVIPHELQLLFEGYRFESAIVLKFILETFEVKRSLYHVVADTDLDSA